MRILILCVATFAGGLLAGAVFLTSDGNGRGRVRESVGEGTERRIVMTVDDDSSVSRRRDEVAAELPAADKPLRDVAGEASEALKRTLASEAASRFLAGEGKITGTIRDPEGRPVAGVIVTATPEAQPFEISIANQRSRAAPHKDRDLEEVSRHAMQGEMWRRHVRSSVETDANGTYELASLVKGRHRLAAYHDDYDVKPQANQNRITPDAVVDFVAQPVVSVPVEVLLPDGTAPGYAWVSWRGPHGNGWEPWKPDGKIRLPLGKTTVKAQTWVPDPLQSEEVEHTVGPDPTDRSIVLQLAGRPVLTAKLALPEGFAVPNGVEFRLRRLEDGAGEVDPATIGRSESRRGTSRTEPGQATWVDLEPGRYLIAAFLGGKRLLGSATGDLGTEAVDVDVPMEPPERGTYLSIMLLGPEGGPIRGQPRFWAGAGPEGRPRLRPTDLMRKTDGTWLVLIQQQELKPGDTGVVRVHAGGYGAAQETYEPRRPGSLTIKFDAPTRLRLRVDRLSGSPAEGRLHAGLVNEKGTQARRQITPDGRCDLGGVQPGEYALLLYIKQGDRTWPILRRPVRMRGEESRMTVSVPVLHTLRVRPNKKLRARGVTIRSSDPEIGPLRRQASLQKGLATFGALAAGEYEIQVNRKRLKVRVPGPPEVRIQ